MHTGPGDTTLGRREMGPQGREGEETGLEMCCMTQLHLLNSPVMWISPSSPSSKIPREAVEPPKSQSE